MRLNATSLAMSAILAAAPVGFANAADVDVDVDAGASTSDNAGGSASASADTRTGASAGNGLAEINTYGELTSTLKAGNSAEPGEIEALEGEIEVDTVLVSSLEGNADTDAPALDEALSAEKMKTDSAQEAVRSNQQIEAAVKAEGYHIDQVVAVQIKSDSEVVVVIDDRA
ncbi:hypothetical protein SAMN04490248_1594 [Salinihabitans flavidus]|uniref:Uncharacterized protein n=1 Tax=Salinihabitans flavidus TaxID=569882 RepID=A0A1H8WFN5_9RHOB|nr:hypothetical protein [Salinihabitans flavidus]SEP26247.1 hypothetical protein SAMN04490248_1594 [Salinihabitans flavidus]